MLQASEGACACAKLHPRSPVLRLSVLGAGPGDARECFARKGIARFESWLLPGGQGLLTYAGGCPTAGAWSFPTLSNDLRFLALAVELPRPAPVLKVTGATAVVQLYRCEENQKREVSLGISSILAQVDGGDVLALKWAPISEESTYALLAVSYGGGLIVIYYIAHAALAACPMRFPNWPVGDSDDKNSQKGQVPVLPANCVSISSNLASRSLAWSPNGRNLLVGFINGSLASYGISASDNDTLIEWEKSWAVSAHEGAVLSVEWLGDTVAVSSGTDFCVCIRDVREPLVTMDVHRDPISWARQLVPVSPTSSKDVAYVTDCGNVRFLVWRNGTQLEVVPGPVASIPYSSAIVQKGALFCAAALYPAQAGTFQDSHAVSGHTEAKKDDHAALPCVFYTAGAQGYVHEITIRRLPSVSPGERVHFIKHRDHRILQSWRQGKQVLKSAVVCVKDTPEDGRASTEPTAVEQTGDQDISEGQALPSVSWVTGPEAETAQRSDAKQKSVWDDGCEEGKVVCVRREIADEIEQFEEIVAVEEENMSPLAKPEDSPGCNKTDVERSGLRLCVEAHHGRFNAISARRHFPDVDTDTVGHVGRRYRTDWCTTLLALDPTRQLLVTGSTLGFITLLVLNPPLHRARGAVVVDDDLEDANCARTNQCGSENTLERDGQNRSVVRKKRVDERSRRLKRKQDYEKKAREAAERRRKKMEVATKKREEEKQRLAKMEMEKVAWHALDEKMNAMLQTNTQRAVEMNTENAKLVADSQAARLQREKKEAEEKRQEISARKAEAAAAAEEREAKAAAVAARKEAGAAQKRARAEAREIQEQEHANRNHGHIEDRA